MENDENLILRGLNIAQKKAVTHLEGPSLIIAGAGSGKTKVLTCKVANLLAAGYDPSRVLALTFTNKAAKEMKERIGSLVGRRTAYRIWAGTFHSVFLRFLRKYSERIGFPAGFTIYDKDDSRSLVKQCVKELELDDKIYKPADMGKRISKLKNDFITAGRYIQRADLIQADMKSRRGRFCDVYELYQKKCVSQGVMDFDDILINTYELLLGFPDVLAEISSQFLFILVDEYQDTNVIQYNIVKLLAKENRNITVVGDDAQSIYAFRGARIENILNFAKDYQDAAIFRLEQNYRSTQVIVNAANSLIDRNKSKISKHCFSAGTEGELIDVINAYTEQEESLLVTASIKSRIYKTHEPFSSFAILYRTNAQSRSVEEALRKKNLPYRIFSGHSFYERKEIKDMIAYLRLVENPLDNEAFKRIINFPARGIGATTLARVSAAASSGNISYCEAIKQYSAEQLGLRPALLEKLRTFVKAIDGIRERLDVEDAYQITTDIDTAFGIQAAMKSDLSIEGQSRLENVSEFFNSVKEFVDEGVAEFIEQTKGGEESSDEIPPLITLDLYLQNVALISDSDSAQSDGKDSADNDNKISLMTVHSAKGLEFKYVYIIGMEENLFPSSSPSSALSEKDIEEERRLFYVALTRAKEGVTLSYAHTRMKWGDYVTNSPSRFLKEIDDKYINRPEQALFSLPAVHPVPPKPRNAQSLPRAFTPQSQMRPKNANFIPDSPFDMKEGQRVEHERFGEGTIVAMSGTSIDRKAVVEFDNSGKKVLLLKFAKMKILK